MQYYGDKNKIAAFETFKRLGIFLPVSDMTLYHGRAANADGSEFVFNPRFSNAGNNTGNRNYNKIDAFNVTEDYEIAKEFGDARARKTGVKNSEVHRIACYDPNAVTINTSYDITKLSDEDKTAYYQAKRELNKFSLFESSPVPFDRRGIALPTKEKIWQCPKNKQGFITPTALKQFTKEQQLDEELATQLASAYNSRMLLGISPSIAVDNLKQDQRYIELDKEKCPLDMLAIATWCDKNHVIGATTSMDSATLGKYIGDVHFLFDLSKINTEEKVEKDKAEGKKKFAGFSKMFYDLQGNSEQTQQLMTTLSQSPKALIQWASAVKGFENVFNQDAGVWENFTVGEHTQTTLQQFEDTYRYKIPQEMIPIINLILIVHDIGKGEASKNHDSHEQVSRNQNKYNVAMSREFLDKLNIDPRLQDIIGSIISDGKDLSFKSFMGKKDASGQAKVHFTALLNKHGISTQNDEIGGIMKVCRILQSCDGAAYTPMAVTVNKDGVAYINANHKFAESFLKPTGLTNRVAELDTNKFK